MYMECGVFTLREHNKKLEHVGLSVHNY